MSNMEDNDFGVPGEGETKQRNFKEMYLKLEQGVNVVQICPGTKTMRKTGKWSKYWALHWGYHTQLEGDKTRAQPIACVEEKSFKNNVITVTRECPECAFIDGIKKKIEKKTVELKDQNKSKEEIRATLKPLTEVLGKGGHQTERRYYCIARTASGKWGVLKMGTRLHKQIDTAIRDAASRGVNLLDPNNCVWWQIKRTGTDFDTEYFADLVQVADMATGGLKVKTSAITETDRQEIRSLPDLMEINARSVVSPDQVAAIVNSGGDPAVVASVFNASRPRQESMEVSEELPVTIESPPKTASVPQVVAKSVAAPQTNQAASQREMLLASGVDPSVIDALFSNG